MATDLVNFLSQSVEKAQQGDYEGALEGFNQLLNLDPHNPDAYGHRCVIRYQLNDTWGALQDCQRASDLYLEQGLEDQYRYTLRMLSRLSQRILNEYQ